MFGSQIDVNRIDETNPDKHCDHFGSVSRLELSDCPVRPAQLLALVVLRSLILFLSFSLFRFLNKRTNVTKDKRSAKRNVKATRMLILLGITLTEILEHTWDLHWFTMNLKTAATIMATN